MESYQNNQKNKLNTPHAIEKNLDKIIIQRMRGESHLSPLSYNPRYQEDGASRLILLGNRSIIINKDNENDHYKSLLGNNYFGNIQHQYLNQRNFYDRMWNLHNENTKHEVEKNKENDIIINKIMDERKKTEENDKQ